METMHDQDQRQLAGNQSLSESPVSVTESPPNQYGIRGLQRNVDEWGILTPIDPPLESKEKKYGVFPGAVRRLPWEAFKDVGFRTVLNALTDK